MKFSRLIFTVIAAFAAAYTYAAPVSMLGENAFLETSKYKACDADKFSFNDKGTVLKIDTTNVKSEWHKIIEFNTGMFQPEKYYTVEIRYKITESDARGGLFFIVRNLPKAEAGTIEDAGERICQGISDGYKTVNIYFRAPQNAKDFAFVIHARGKLRANVKDVKLFEGFTSTNMLVPEIPAKPYDAEIKNIPTGAKDFDIALPAPAAEAKIVNAAEFGFAENADGSANFKSLTNAIEHCKKIGASKLVVNKGQYKIFNRENSEPISFKEFKDFTFDGGGSTFVFWKKGGSYFRMNSCERTKFCNFNLDWNWAEDPIISIVEILESGNAANGENFVTFKFCDFDKFPNRNPRIAIFCNYDPETLRRKSEWGMGIALSGHREKGLKKEWISDNVLKLTGPQIRKVKVGDKKFLQHYYYDRNAFELFDNSNMTLENINIWSCPGHAFFVNGIQQYFQFKNVNIVLRPDVKRPKITCSADHLHFGSSRGFFKMLGCEFSYGIDDCSNFHDCSGFARKIGENSLLTQNASGFPKGSKIELRQGDYSPTGFVGTVKETIGVDPSKRVYEIVFEEKLPEQKFDGFVMFNKRFDTHNILIKDCKFHDTVCRGLLILARDVTIENCRFERHDMGGLKLETGYTFNVWSEGYGVKNIVIRNNFFNNVNLTEHKHGGWARDIFMGVYMKIDPSEVGTMYPIISDVLIENNTFEDSSGLIAYITSTGNVIVRNNHFYNRNPTKSNFPYRGGFYVGYSTDTKIVNNVWHKSQYTPNIAVFFDKSTAKKLIFSGNSVIDDNKQN